MSLRFAVAVARAEACLCTISRRVNVVRTQLGQPQPETPHFPIGDFSQTKENVLAKIAIRQKWIARELHPSKLQSAGLQKRKQIALEEGAVAALKAAMESFSCEHPPTVAPSPSTPVAPAFPAVVTTQFTPTPVTGSPVASALPAAPALPRVDSSIPTRGSTPNETSTSVGILTQFRELKDPSSADYKGLCSENTLKHLPVDKQIIATALCRKDPNRQTKETERSISPEESQLLAIQKAVKTFLNAANPTDDEKKKVCALDTKELKLSLKDNLMLTRKCRLRKSDRKIDPTRTQITRVLTDQLKHGRTQTRVLDWITGPEFDETKMPSLSELDVQTKREWRVKVACIFLGMDRELSSNEKMYIGGLRLTESESKKLRTMCVKTSAKTKTLDGFELKAKVQKAKVQKYVPSEVEEDEEDAWSDGDID